MQYSRCFGWKIQNPKFEPFQVNKYAAFKTSYSVFFSTRFAKSKIRNPKLARRLDDNSDTFKIQHPKSKGCFGCKIRNPKLRKFFRRQFWLKLSEPTSLKCKIQNLYVQFSETISLKSLIQNPELEDELKV